MSRYYFHKSKFAFEKQKYIIDISVFSLQVTISYEKKDTFCSGFDESNLANA